MPVDGVNSRMTTLQFARAVSRQRTVETSDSATSNGTGTRETFLASGALAPPAPGARRAPAALPPASFHWSYRPVVTNGKTAAKRIPQFADSTYWSVALNSVG